MATSDISHVEFVDICEGNFCFQDMDEDAFRKSSLKRDPQKNYFIQSNDNKFLVLNAENKFQAQNLTVAQQCQLDCKFKIQTYNNLPPTTTTLPEEMKTAAMLYTQKKGSAKYMVASCGQGDDVRAEEMDDLPVNIEGIHHKAVFYMKKLSSSYTYKFQSSTYPTKYLGFKTEHNHLVLVLREVPSDFVDTSSEIKVK